MSLKVLLDPVIIFGILRFKISSTMIDYFKSGCDLNNVQYISHFSEPQELPLKYVDIRASFVLFCDLFFIIVNNLYV